uniref:Uncharacterized protein n=1 Tax=Clastoptera arizonana TaxID=38151 RepID=A0A1B6DY60_9HEMI
MATVSTKSLKKISSFKRIQVLNSDLDTTYDKKIKHKKCKVVFLVRDQICEFLKRQSIINNRFEEIKKQEWWNLQKKNLYTFLIALSLILFIWSTLVLLGAASCNLYNVDCTCYSNFRFIPWFANNKEKHLLF